MQTNAKVPELSGIVVSSDANELLAVAEKYRAEGVQTRKREDFYASDTGKFTCTVYVIGISRRLTVLEVSHSQYFEHIAEAEVGDADEVLYCPVTVIQWLKAPTNSIFLTCIWSFDPTTGTICFSSRF